jgi:hypothetical protein
MSVILKELNGEWGKSADKNRNKPFTGKELRQIKT